MSQSQAAIPDGIAPPTVDNEALAQLKSLMDTLVPPENLEITDIFGETYKVSTNVSARSQVKIIRELEQVKDMELGLNDLNSLDVPSMIFKVAGNEKLMEMMCRCLKLAFPLIVANTEAKAKEKGVPFEEPSPADLFGLEEVVAAIIPLFLRVARRTGQAITALSKINQDQN